MPLFDIIVLATIVTVFVSFGAVLGFLTWYCSDKRKHGHRSGQHPAHHGNWGLITDD
jgi:hypothetical protein